ncbi:MAG: MBL fold metallo-hydrolase [Candidatus Eiseniibacteriota bacterium]|nr:MAG: MBL fold metallo-hydrolase [Candidatus Eisenbacteria bacterium]
MFLAALLVLVPAAASGDLTIYCLDVGQGDATLVVSSSGQTLLFDGGDNGKGNSVINPYLSSLGISNLTYMAASHHHADHIGGLDEVYTGTGVDSACYDRGWSYTTQTYQSYANTVAPLRQTISDGQTIDLGDGVTVQCVAVNGNGVLSSPFTQPPHDENDLCVVLIVTCGEFDFIVGGDLGGYNTSSYADIETSLSLELSEVEVYRVNHHGSGYSSNPSFLATLSPEVSVISVGTNGYGHPTQSAIDRIVAAGSYIYQTELGSGGTIPPGSGEVVGGHVIIETDGATYYSVDGDVYDLEGTVAVDLVDQAVPFAGLLDACPNPFYSTTALRYRVHRPAQRNVIALFDVLGRQLRSWEVTGSGELLWDGTDASGAPVASGIYFCTMTNSDGIQTRKILLTR